jgi:hypothetical protein
MGLIAASYRPAVFGAAATPRRDTGERKKLGVLKDHLGMAGAPFPLSGAARLNHSQKSFSRMPPNGNYRTALALPKPNPVDLPQDVTRGERWIGHGAVGPTAGTPVMQSRFARDYS